MLYSCVSCFGPNSYPDYISNTKSPLSVQICRNSLAHLSANYLIFRVLDVFKAGDREKLLVVLRDGRTLIGFLRSIDQFANLVLHRTIERIHVGKKYGDIPRGIFVVRGENVVLLGEIDTENETNLPLHQVSVDEILEMQREEQIEKQQEEEKKKKALLERGLAPHPDPIQDDFF